MDYASGEVDRIEDAHAEVNSFLVGEAAEEAGIGLRFNDGGGHGVGQVKGSGHFVGGQFVVRDEEGGLAEGLGIQDPIKGGALQRGDRNLNATS